MKNIKKFGLVSFLACASLAGGIMMANTEAPAEPVKEFKMVEGAQVRVPDVVEGEYVKDGIRFTATMTDAFWQEKGAMENLAVGMFIMPADYATKPINYENCFGADACYYWGEYDGETDGKKEILHVESYAYEEVAGADYLTMKASIWNLNAENLDLEFVAVAYLTDGTNYWFAETAEGAKTVSVAQKALLNSEDEIHATEDGAALVEDAYVNAYLGEGKEVSYTENVYKETASGVYTLMGTEEKSVVVTAYNTEAGVEAIADYKSFDYKNNKASRVVLFDGSAVVDTYYNYSANRIVIWDDEVDCDKTVGNTNCDTLTSKVGTKDHMNLFNNEEDTYAGADGAVSYPADQQKVIYEGDSASINLRKMNSWDGPAWMFKDLGVTTNTFSFILYTERDLNDAAIEIYAYGEDFTKYRWITPVSFNLQTLDLLGESTNLNEDSNYKTYNAGLYKVTLTFDANIRYLVGWSFRADTAVDIGNPYYIDNLCAESSVYLENKQWNIPSTFEDGASELTFDAVINAKSTYAYANDAAAITTYAQYQVYGAEDWTDLNAVDGKYSFSITDQTATYMIKLTATNGEKSESKTFSVVNDKYTLFDFEEDASLEGGYNGYRKEYTADGTCVITEGGANNGSYAVRSYSNGSLSWDGWNPQSTPVNISRFGMWITSRKAYSSWTVELNVGGWKAQTFALKAGTHYYEFDVAQGTLTGDLVVIDFTHNPQDYYVIDNIVLK